MIVGLELKFMVNQSIHLFVPIPPGRKDSASMKTHMVTDEYLEGILRHVMPLMLRVRIRLHLVLTRNSKAIRGNLAGELHRRRHVTTPREQIGWFPIVDASRCDGCRKCYEFCPKGVFDIINNRAEAANPFECVLLCSGCVSKCPRDAISFPDRADFVKYVEYR